MPTLSIKDLVCKSIPAASLIMATVITAGCSGNEKKSQDCDTAASVRDTIEKPAEPQHADNDIAMTIRSIVDVINLGESLDSAFYSYKGILTDGSGKPLYTDTEGAPGTWLIEVPSPKMATIRNTNPGDLLPEQLTAYIAESLELKDKDLITSRVYKDMGKEAPTNVRIYDFGKGTIHFETRTELTTNGTESPVLSITIEGTKDGK